MHPVYESSGWYVAYKNPEINASYLEIGLFFGRARRKKSPFHTGLGIFYLQMVVCEKVCNFW